MSNAQPGEVSHPESLSDIELIEYMLNRYHDVHRQQLPELIRLAQRVERMHGGHVHCPDGLSAHLERMLEDLEAHMQKEEQILFPMICRGIRDLAVHPISIMRGEHEEHAVALAEIDNLTRGLQLPDEACSTWRGLYQGLQMLKVDLQAHIRLENDVLFARIDGGNG